jgi:hypothetical protein
MLLDYDNNKSSNRLISSKNLLNESKASSVYSPMLISRKNSVSKNSECEVGLKDHTNLEEDKLFLSSHNTQSKANNLNIVNSNNLNAKNNLSKNLKQAVVNRGSYSTKGVSSLTEKPMSIQIADKSRFGQAGGQSGTENFLSFHKIQNPTSNKNPVQEHSKTPQGDSSDSIEEINRRNLARRMPILGKENWDDFRKLEKREKIVN